MPETNFGNWQTVWSLVVSEDASQPRPESETRIEQDPQIKEALSGLKSLGVVDPAMLRQAIRIGAATMSAQQNADGQFLQFRDRYLRQLDGPPLK